MEDAGLKLKRARERLGLSVRDVDDASAKIAARHGNDEFLIAYNRVSDIENNKSIPTFYRLYSLCAIYRLDMSEVLSWYGASPSSLPADSGVIQIDKTHEVGFREQKTEVQFPSALDPLPDPIETAYVTRLIQRWGKVPLTLFDHLDPKTYRYAWIGRNDWSMFPIIPPGSLVVIDDTQRKIAASGWTSEFDRPIYFLEHEGGYRFGWCSVNGGLLTVQFHPSSRCEPETYAFPGEIDVIGEITCVAMTLGQSPLRPDAP